MLVAKMARQQNYSPSPSIPLVWDHWAKVKGLNDSIHEKLCEFLTLNIWNVICLIFYTFLISSTELGVQGGSRHENFVSFPSAYNLQLNITRICSSFHVSTFQETFPYLAIWKHRKGESCFAVVSIANVVSFARGVLRCKYENPAASHSPLL